MEKISIILVSESSYKIATDICRELKEQYENVVIYSKTQFEETIQIASVSDVTHSLFQDSDALIFIGAMGICVRCIAPCVNDKHVDPAVICVDSTGKYIIPVLSGHIGGANALSKLVASITGGEAVVTTQSDNAGLWALDTLADKYGWGFNADSNTMNTVISKFVAKRPVAMIIETDDMGTHELVETKPEHVHLYSSLHDYKSDSGSKYESLIVVSPMKAEGIEIPMIQYFPKVLHLGIGCQKSVPVEIAEQIISELKDSGFAIESIATIGTIEQKKDEPLIAELAKLCFNSEIRIYDADELNNVDVPNPSERVFETVGTYGVAEAAALKGGENTYIVKEKYKGKYVSASNTTLDSQVTWHYTFAVAMERNVFTGGHIEIVGAGPGDPELISIRGRRFLENADLILYAGSLVPRELTYCAKQGAVVRSSASMALEEQFELMKDFYDRGLLVVRLHTGDPCIYGAIQEQMNFFDKYGMSYHITPGISSFLAAAAELRSQFTIPEKVQTIILTRGEGITPMPEREKLHLLARSKSTMCIFLSASIARQVQDELLSCYPPETPVAACYRLTWKDQRIFRGELRNLAKMIEENNLTLTTMIVVGDAIGNREGLSKLYDRSFTHLWRKGK